MNLKVGDIVEFELYGINQKNRPRWIDNKDYGGENVWTKGAVKEINEYIITVSYTIVGFIGTGIAEWPNVLNPVYNPEQWAFPGYLRKKYTPIIIKCECGGDKLKLPHSNWCPKKGMNQKIK